MLEPVNGGQWSLRPIAAAIANRLAGRQGACGAPPKMCQVLRPAIPPHPPRHPGRAWEPGVK